MASVYPDPIEEFPTALSESLKVRVDWNGMEDNKSGREKYENLALARSKAFTHEQLHQCGQHLKSQRATLRKEHESDAGF